MTGRDASILQGGMIMKNLAIAFMALLLVFAFAPAADAEPSHCPYDIHLSVMYNTLSDAERLLYDRLYDALYTGQETAAVPSGVSRERAEWMVDFIYNEAPELCAYDRWASQVTTVSGGMQINLKYKMPLREQERFIQETTSNARYYAGLGQKKGLRAIHDDLSALFSYGYVDGEDTQLAYFALKNRKAVCNGYAQTFVMYAHFAGFTSSYIDGGIRDDKGLTDARHAWNIACENGRYFWLDATWDDEGSTAADTWYGLDGEAMIRTHVPDGEYQPILNLKTVLPENVTCTMHLDVNNDDGYSRGITQQDGAAVRLRDLSSGEYYSPALVIWNDSRGAVSVAVSYKLDGETGGWGAYRVEPNSNLAFRTNAAQLKGKTGYHEIVWYCDGIRIDAFTWWVE